MRSNKLRKVGASIRDVAKEAGLSIATVSRVMNGNTNVNPKTRQQVLDVCQRLDYLPNSAARALSTSRSKTIAAIIPTIEHSVFAKYISAIERTLGEHGYSLVMAISNADQDEELKAARKLLGMGAEAFILTGADHSSALLQSLRVRGVPHVLTSIWDPDNAVATIGYDNEKLAENAVRYLMSKGHRRIAIVHGPLSGNDRTVARRQGAANVVKDGARLDFYETDLSISGGKKALQQLLSTQPNCTAALCFSDVLALGLYYGLAEMGKTVPHDLSVMGFDNLDWASETVPPLTTIDLPAASMGHIVARDLVECLENGSALTKRLLDVQIIERASVRQITYL